MTPREVPVFLTVEEAAGILRISRTAAYEQTRKWRATDGGDGLPVRMVGGSLRVPTAQFEAHYDVRVTSIPIGDEWQTTTTARAQDIPRSEPKTRRRGRKAGPPQTGLPFAG